MTTEKERKDSSPSPTAPAPPKPSAAPSVKLLMIFAATVIISLSFQKALPTLDIALSCHAKTLCSSTFLSNRLPSQFDIGAVRVLDCSFRPRIRLSNAINHHIIHSTSVSLEFPLLLTSLLS